MPFYALHYILEIRYRNEPCPVFVESTESLDGVLLVEVVEELAEFRVVYASFFYLPEVQLRKTAFHVKGDSLVQFSFFHHLGEFV